LARVSGLCDSNRRKSLKRSATEENNFPESLAPRNKSVINGLNNTARSVVSNNPQLLFFAAPAARFCKRDISRALEREFGGFGHFFGCCLQTECFNAEEFTFQVPQSHKIIHLSILGCDEQNLQDFLSDFKWSGRGLALVFADGW